MKGLKPFCPAVLRWEWRAGRKCVRGSGFHADPVHGPLRLIHAPFRPLPAVSEKSKTSSSSNPSAGGGICWPGPGWIGQVAGRVNHSSGTLRVAIVSDVHYAGEAERLRRQHESRAISNPLLRIFLAAWRRWVWLADPFAHNGLLDDFIAANRGCDLAVANGDYSCDTAFVGVADDAAFASAGECLQRLRVAFAGRLHVTMGDHELGKKSFFGGAGGMRLASWPRAVRELAIPPIWSVRYGRYWLVGVTSSLWALPVYAQDALSDEYAAWEELREEQGRALDRVLAAMGEGERWILFCHDPSALPFLAERDSVSNRLRQLECTLFGHLHSELIYWKSRLLAGMPQIAFMGNSVRRMSGALRRSSVWPRFRVRLCPSLAGLECAKDGGYLAMEIHPDADHPVRILRCRLPRRAGC